MNEDKSSRYHRHRRRAEGLAVAARVLSLVGIGSGFSLWLAATVGRLPGLVSVPPSLLTTAVIVAQTLTLSVVCDLAALPFVAYSRFWLERKYRQAECRPIVWLAGYGRAMSLHVAVWICSALTVYATIWAWPTVWWLVTGVAFVLVMVTLTHVGSVLILPWFYELKPLDRPNLRARLESLTRRVGTPLAAIQEWRLGLEKGRPDAALVGIGSTRRVLLSDALLADYSDDEIEVVLAHELAHHAHHDIWKTIVYEATVVVAACGAANLVMQRFGAALGMTGLRDVGGLPLLVVVAGAVVTILAPVRNVLSRRHERLADQYALELTKNPTALVSSLRRFGEQTLAEERPSRLVEWLFYTHPPMADRMSAARAAAENAVR